MSPAVSAQVAASKMAISFFFMFFLPIKTVKDILTGTLPLNTVIYGSVSENTAAVNAHRVNYCERFYSDAFRADKISALLEALFYNDTCACYTCACALYYVDKAE